MSATTCKHPNCESRAIYLDGLCYVDFKRADRIRGEGAQVPEDQVTGDSPVATTEAAGPRRQATKRAPAKKAAAKRGGRK